MVPEGEAIKQSYPTGTPMNYDNYHYGKMRKKVQKVAQFNRKKI